MFNWNKQLMLGWLLACSSQIVFALPFTITPKSGYPLPAVVYSGNSATAYYTIVNNTGSQRNNNYIRFLPLNVTQITNGTFSDTCGQNFNLAPTGQPGNSCTLQLSVNGSVDSGDPDPAHHLFACFPGGTVCAGTLYPLSVTQLTGKVISAITISSPSTKLIPNRTLQLSAIGQYSDGSSANVNNLVNWSSSSSNASISATGLVTGITNGTATISATLGTATSNSITMTVNSYAYVANLFNSTLSQCLVNPSTGVLSNCGTTGNGFTGSNAVGINPAATLAYVTNQSTPTTVSVCILNPDGSLGSCTRTGATNAGYGTGGVLFSSTGQYIYVSNSSGNSISYCSLNADGSFNVCNQTGVGALNGPKRFAMNANGSMLYIAAAANVYACTITSNGSLGVCNVTGSGFSGPSDLAFSVATGNVYVVNSSTSNVSYCSIGSNGALTNCANAGASGLVTPTAIAMNAAGTVAYITNLNTNTISVCQISGTGTFSSCVTSGSGLSGPYGITVH